VVDCRYFAGLTDDETALALGLSVRTAQREWFKARAWLRHELSGGKA
jgi:DNA-directed RNA polymerase specialized sigma24 family protein